MSKEALERLVAVALKGNGAKDSCSINEGTGPEDVQIGRCLEGVNVEAGDARDELSRGRFFSDTPEGYLFPDRWAGYAFYPLKKVNAIQNNITYSVLSLVFCRTTKFT